MKTRYRYIHFDEAEGVGWYCYNNKSETTLGCVTYYARWRQWVIDFKEDCVFNVQCLQDIADFLGQLNKKPKPKQEAEG